MEEKVKAFLELATQKKASDIFIIKESDDAILSGDTDLDGAVTTDGQAAGSAN